MSSQAFDRYTRASGWKRVLFNDLGRGLQSAELNELQHVLSDEFAQMVRTIFSDGSIVRGLELVLQAGLAKITPGQIYWNGWFHDFVGGQVAYTGTGTEVIGLLFTETTLTEVEDPSLLDPTLDWENKSLPGAWRLTYTITVTNNNASALTIYTLVDGVVVSTARPEPDFTELAKTLARRTNDESGSYLVRGARSSVEARDATTYNLVTGEGKGYVNGFEITLPAPVRTAVDRPLDVRTVASEPKVFSTSVDQYLLNNTPVKLLSTVTGIVNKVVTVTRGNTPGGQDLMPYVPISSIVSVVQGATTYATPGDYLVSGDYVSWSPGGAEPATGSTYTVTLRYVKTMVANTDYILTGNYLDFSPAGDNPVNGTTVYVSYQHYLPRYDTVAMDQAGKILVVRGAPSIFPSAPPIPAGTLPLATVYYPANAAVGDVVATDTGLYRLSMADLVELRERIRDLEYNVAVSDLDQEALNIELPTTKKAIFTDPFMNLIKVDTGNVLWSAAIDPVTHTLVPSFTLGFDDLLGQAGSVKMLTYTEVDLLSQPFATDVTNVNPYAVFSDLGVLTLTPPDDVWIDEQTIFVESSSWTPGNRFNFWTEMRRDTSEELVLGQSRARTVAVTGRMYTPNADNLTLMMDGIVYSMTPTGATLAGTNAGTVKSNADGEFTATYNVPAGLLGGMKEVVVSNLNNRGVTQYRIAGIRRTTIVTQLNITVDPVAQTFTVPESVFVCAVDLFFSTKDAALGLNVSIRNVVNGYPGQEILAEKTMLPANVGTSNNGATATHVVFGQPAYCEAGREYAIVVATESNEYGIYYARLGRRDLVTNQYIGANPHTGVMFTSANSSTWSADQSADLKFRLYRAEFTSPAVADFDAVVVDGSLLYLLADQFTPVGTRVTWEYSPDAGGSWIAIEPDVDVDTGTALTGVDVRATLTGTDKLSPIIAVPPGLLTVKWAATGTYVSRNTVLSAYTELRVYMDIKVPSGTSVTIQYSINDGASWVNMGAGTLQAAVGDGYSEYLWTATGLANPTNLRLRVDLTANADRTQIASARRLRAIAT